ncbi:hypothetical protein Y032_0258g420 [Ancylostoma ceylanicum]|uniref:Peptidase S1 domain-containing protein n=1 Tax=Ancylostoma ceylanicum TaxID=53326 RepID=A0A016SBA8_9BILA|nr:hypothetical protein Y032_0258g420 [Ancylostoma ceylanicum]
MSDESSRYELGDKYALCAGVQISSRHIMTAAHCVMVYNRELNSMQCLYRKERRKFERDFLPAQNISVYVGTRCNFPESCVPRHEAAKIWAHEQWDICDLSHDIALIELRNNVPLGQSSPICMPEENTKLAILLRSAGSGMDSTITSENKYARGVQVVNLRIKSENKALAAITTNSRNSAMCGGDSGGPLFQFNTHGQYIVVGVVSDNENFFADVRLHLTWICNRTGVCPISARTNASGIGSIAPVGQ